jgi:hypothetical protein
VVVVDVFRPRPIADWAHATLQVNEFFNFSGPDPVTPHQVIVAAAAIETFACFTSALVMTWLAVGRESIAGALVAWDLVREFPLAAVRTSLHASIVRSRCDD